MKTVTKILLSVISAVTLVLQSPSVQAYVTQFISSHPGISSALAGIGGIGLLIHNPKASA